jgi:hypothetical protein
MKKQLLTLGLLTTLGLNAQNGLEGVFVEKYYVSDTADSLDADANGAVYPLRVGSVTYRVYANLLPGYSVIQMYGDVNHDFKVETTTSFYNDPNFGVAFYGGTSVNNTKKNTQLIDSYFTIGGVASGMMGVPKTEDTDGSIGNTQGILANNDPTAGVPITGMGAQDGLMPGSPIALNTLGFTNELNIFDQTAGATFLTNGGTIAALGGIQGVTASNSVLLGQFTTDGDFSFQLNIQLGTPTPGQSEIYVASNPVGNELQDSSLIYSSAVTDTSGGGAGLADLMNVNMEIMLFPNPTLEKTTIYLSNYTHSTPTDKMTLLNLNGQVLFDQKLIAQNGKMVSSIDLSTYQKGMYLLDFVVGDKHWVRPVLKN